MAAASCAALAGRGRGALEGLRVDPQQAAEATVRLEQTAGEIDDVLPARARPGDDGDELCIAQHPGTVAQQLLARALVAGQVVDGAVAAGSAVCH